MSAPRAEEGASAPSNVLAFPKRDKGRVRRRNSVYSMGRTAIAYLEGQGGEVAPSVTLLNPPKRERDVAREAMTLALLIYSHLPAEQKANVLISLRLASKFGDDPSARELYEYLRGCEISR